MRLFSVKVRTYATVQGKLACIRDYECKTCVQEEKGRKIGHTDKLRQNLLLHNPIGKTCPHTQHRNKEIKSNSSTLNTKNPQRETTRKLPTMVTNYFMERIFLWLGVYHNRQLNSKNQSFPICKRNQTTNTKGS